MPHRFQEARIAQRLEDSGLGSGLRTQVTDCVGEVVITTRSLHSDKQAACLYGSGLRDGFNLAKRFMALQERES
jgi:hypothetical protein